MKFRNLVVIGTSHIASQSLRRVKSAIEECKPDVVAVELDRKRAFAVLYGKRSRLSIAYIPRIGLKGYLFSLLGSWIQRKLGETVGVVPGSEMKAAMSLAIKNGLKVALIDRDIEVTMKRFSGAFSWRERFNLLFEVIMGLIFRKRALKELGVDFDLRKVPEKRVVKRLIGHVEKRYPNVYRVLIKERDEFMARNLARIMKAEPDKRIVAVVGAGHEEEIIRLVKNELRKGFTYTVSVG